MFAEENKANIFALVVASETIAMAAGAGWLSFGCQIFTILSIIPLLAGQSNDTGKYKNVWVVQICNWTGNQPYSLFANPVTLLGLRWLTLGPSSLNGL